MEVAGSMEVSGATQVGVLDHHSVRSWRVTIALGGDEGGDALVGECAAGNGLRRYHLGVPRPKVLEQPQHTQAGSYAGIWVTRRLGGALA